MDQFRLSRPLTRLSVARRAAVLAALAAGCASGPSTGNGGGAGITSGVVTGNAGAAGTSGGAGTVGSSGGMTSTGTPAGNGGASGGAVQPTTGGGGNSPTGTTAGSGGPAVATGGGGGGTPAGGGQSTSGGAGGAPEASGGAGTTAGGGGAEWWFDGPRPAPAIGSWPPPGIKLTEVTAGATQPTAIAAPRGDTTRLYFTEKWGIIRLIKDGVLVEAPALDMREAVLEGGPQGSTGDEMEHQGKRGLVGLAFHPNYEENGRIFVMYVADQGIPGYGTTDHTNLYDDGDMTFAEYHRSDSNPDVFDPEPVAVFLQFDKGNCDQCSQHNGGSLEIGVDGFLWADTGDPPPYDNPGSQDLNNLNGKLLRFDITASPPTAAGNYPGADPFVESVGIRNAYKFSIDRYTGDVYVGDVGENSWEEVSVQRYADRNRDHEWPKKEGLQSFMALSCDEDNCLDPVFDYGHSGMEGDPGADNCIVGGYVYRGQAIPALQGTYLYGDYGSGKIRALQVVDGALTNGPYDFPGLTMFLGCFGEDAAGEMYVCNYNDGKIMRVDAQ